MPRLDPADPDPSSSTSTGPSSTRSRRGSRPGSRRSPQAGLPTTHDQLAPLIGLDGKRLAREIAALAGRPIDEARSEEIDERSGEIYERLNRRRGPCPGSTRRRGDRDGAASRGRSRRRAARSRSRRRSPRSGLPTSRRSSTPATSSTRSPSRISCCSRRRRSASSRPAAGTSATRRGTWSRPSPRA